jgi:hypothetical protein
MSITPNPSQQRSIDAVAAALRAQPGEFTLSAPENTGQLDMTILSPDQPLKLTIGKDGQLSEIAFYDADEENCEADGALTQGRLIDLEPDSIIGGALYAAVATAHPTAPKAPEPSAQSLLTTLSDQLLDLRDGVSKKRYNVSAEEAYERAATLVRTLRDKLPTGPNDGGRRAQADEILDGPETSAADHVTPAELRDMIGLPKLPFTPAAEALVANVAQSFYLMHPELDHLRRVKPWPQATYEARTGHTGNALRILNTIIRGEDPYSASFARVPLTRRHVEAAESAYAEWQQKAA